MQFAKGTPVSTIPVISDKDGFNRLLSQMNRKMNENKSDGMNLVWLYLNDTIGHVLNRNENEYKRLTNEYAINLVKLFDNAPMNSLFMIVAGEKNIDKLKQMRRELSIASKCGDAKNASNLAAKISKEEYKFRQYPFWISVKNNTSVNQRSIH